MKYIILILFILFIVSIPYIVKLLYKMFSIDEKTRKQRILKESIYAGDIKTIKRLLWFKFLPNGVDIKRSGRFGLQPLLCMALESKQVKIAELLINKGTDLDESLRWASKNGKNDLIDYLINKGADVNKFTKYQTPLLIALENGHESTAELLINRGADIHLAEEINEKSTLLKASETGLVALMEMFISNGINVNIRSNHNITPLIGALHVAPTDNASKDRKKAAVELLLSKGADVNVKDIYGKTPLFWAVTNNYRDIVEILIANGADVIAENKPGETPLSNALIKDHNETADLLLSHYINMGLQVQLKNDLYDKLLKSLRRIADPKSKDLLIQIYQNNPFFMTKIKIIEILGIIKNPTVGNFLIDILEKSEEKYAKMRAIGALGELKETKATGKLCDILLNIEIITKKCPLEGVWIDNDFIPKVTQPYDVDTNAYLRYHSAIALGKIGDMLAVDSLKKAAEHDKSKAVRAAALMSLCSLVEIEWPNLLKVCCYALSDISFWYQPDFIIRIKNVTMDNSLEIMPYWKGDDPLQYDYLYEFVRYHAAVTLGKIGNEKCLDRLREAVANDNSEKVRNAALNSLKILENKKG